MPAGAIPMPFRPNLIVTGLCSFAPFCGAMKYTSAPAGAAMRSAAKAVAATKHTPKDNNRRLMGISLCKERSLQLQGRIHECAGHREAEHDRIDEEEHNRFENSARPTAAKYPAHGHEGVDRQTPTQNRLEKSCDPLELWPRAGRLDDQNQRDRHRKIKGVQMHKEKQVFRVSIARTPIHEHVQKG